MKKIKILISTIVISAVMMSLTGCGENNKDKGENITKPAINTEDKKATEDKKENSKKGTYVKDPDLTKILKAELTTQSYWIDAPRWGVTRAGSGWISSNDNINVIYDQFLENSSPGKYKIDASSIKTPDQVIEGMKGQFLSTGTCELPSTKKREYEITKKENVEINGWDMCRYEGHFILANTSLKDNKASFVAYGVIKDKHPVYFIVVDKTDEQNQGKELGVLADKIAKTFRDVGVE